MNEIILQNKNDQVLASSRDIAERFGKRHDKLTSEIERMYSELIGSDQNGGHPMFIKTTYINSQNHQEYKEYLMNRDGFSLLVMGFTGKKALEWKLKYIEAFNKMEETIKSGNYLTEEEKLKLQLFSKDASEVAYAHNRLIEIATAPLIQKNETLINENDLLAQKNLEWANKPLINALVRAYASSIGNDFAKAWNSFKKELLYKYSINLNSRITNYLNISGKKTKPKTLDMLDDSEISCAISTIVSMCRENEVNIDDLLNNKAS